MLIGVALTINTETGDYDIRFNNVTKPGEPMDYHLMTEALTKVFADFQKQVEEMGPDSNENIKKEIH